MNLRRLQAVTKKELLHIVRDVRSLILALVQPLMMLLLFGYALTLDVDRIPTYIYDLDRTPQSRDLIDHFRGSRYFEIRGVVDNYPAIERAVDKNTILLGVVISQDYGRHLLAGQQADVQLLADGSDSNTASIALGYAQLLVQTYAADLRSDAAMKRGGQQLRVTV